MTNIKCSTGAFRSVADWWIDHFLSSRGTCANTNEQRKTYYADKLQTEQKSLDAFIIITATPHVCPTQEVSSMKSTPEDQSLRATAHDSKIEEK